MEIGTVLISKWGWEQTNIDFYEVVKITEKTVTIRQIASKEVESDTSMSGYVIPDKGSYIGEPIRRKILNAFGKTFVSINSYSSADVWTGNKERYTAYA